MRRMLLWTLTACILTGGCDRTPATPPGPKAVLTQLLEARRVSDHARVVSLTTDGHGGDLVSVLPALDDFLTTNRSLRDWTREHVSRDVADAIDQAYVPDVIGLGLFSDDVELLDESIDGAQATVSYVIGDQLPARRATCVRENGQWRLKLDVAPSRNTAQALTEMAQGLRVVLTELTTGRLDAALLRDDPQPLLESLQRQLRRGVEMLPRPASQPESAPAAQ